MKKEVLQDFLELAKHISATPLSEVLKPGAAASIGRKRRIDRRKRKTEKLIGKVMSHFDSSSSHRV